LSAIYTATCDFRTRPVIRVIRLPKTSVSGQRDLFQMGIAQSSTRGEYNVAEKTRLKKSSFKPQVFSEARLPP
jgi:hypothetical protein